MSNQTTQRDQWGNLAVALSCKMIVIENDKIWLRKNERGNWELPGGRLEDSEQPDQTVIREIQEELGKQVTNASLIDMYVWKKSFGVSTHIGIVTFTGEVAGTTSNFEHIGEAGEASFQQFSINEALELANLEEPYMRSLTKFRNENH